ncbi:MAG: hypothetical protein AAGA42_17790, partial [Actinomycetota bacterium]
PTFLPDGMRLAAYLDREDPRDALIAPGANSIEDLKQGAVVGTASLRREAILRNLRPDLDVVLLRGNVGSRLKKVADGKLDAAILAHAGTAGADRPLALIDSCLFGAPARGERLAWATTEIVVDGAVWTYVVALNTADPGSGSVEDRVALAEIGIAGTRYVYDWRTGQGDLDDEVRAGLAPRDWALFVCCPVVDDGNGGISVTVGDPTKYATMATAPERWERRRLSA